MATTEYTALEKLLLTALGAETSAILGLFWLLIASKKSELDLALRILPIATILEKAVETISKLVERQREDRNG